MNEVVTVDAPAKVAKFYCYNQNNSGGSFILDESVSHFVIIEAYSAKEANAKAEDVGIYFDGCSTGQDCRCCGDRWYAPWSDNGDATPMIYAKDPLKYKDDFCRDGDTYCIVYMLDGGKKIYRKQPA